MDDELDRDGNCKGKRYCPDVERQVRLGNQILMSLRKQVAQQPCTQARHDQKRKYLRKNHTEGNPEGDSFLRMHHRHDGRHKKGYQKVDQNRVCRDAGNIASEFPGHYRSRGGRGTDEA